MSPLAATTNLRPQQTRYVVEFQRPATRAAQLETLRRFRGDLARISAPRETGVMTQAEVRPRHEYVHTFFGAAVEVPQRSVGALRRLPYVRAVHEDVAMELHQGEVIDAGVRMVIKSLPTRGEGIRIGVLDTGIDYNHPALGGGFGPGFKVAGGYDFAEGDSDPIDPIGHGTHVAGIIAADSPTLIGVAPKATLYAYKVFEDDGYGVMSYIIAALERSADPNGDGDTSDHLDVVNMSLGGPGHSDSPVSRATDAATALGIIVCVSAGNNGGYPAAVMSPASARTAITVGAYESSRGMAFFSSAGPAPKTLAFKPDVAAPGVDIISSWKGGGTRAASGTSMAAPHIAGVVALLRKLHPDWSPARIKNALISTATPIVEERPFRRGSGIAYGAAASAATVIPDVPALALGLDHAAGGTFSATRTITFTNHGTASQQLTAEARPVKGVSVSVTPSSFTIAPGGTQTVELRFDADNAQIPFDEDTWYHGSDVEFSGTSTLTVPWGFVRATRLSFAYPAGYLYDVKRFERPGGSGVVRAFNDGSAELFTFPDTINDFAMFAFDGLPADVPWTLRVFTREDVKVTGDEVAAIDPAEATRHYVMDARDDEGTPLALLPEIRGRRGHQVTLRLRYDQDVEPTRTDYDIFFAQGLGNVRDVYFAPITPRFRFEAFETYVDVDNMRAFVARQGEITADMPGGTMTILPPEYTRARVTWRRTSAEKELLICGIAGFNHDFGTYGFNCYLRPLDGNASMDVFATNDAGYGSMVGLFLSTYITEAPLVRAMNGTMVLSTEVNPGVNATRVAHGGRTTVGVGPFHPFLFRGTEEGMSGGYSQIVIGLPLWGFVGAHGDNRIAERNRASWTMYDAAGAIAASGVVESSSIPRAKIGYRYVVTSSFNGPGVTSRGVYEVKFGNNAQELRAPTISALRVTDASGAPADELRNGEKATLHVSLGDYAAIGGAIVRPLAADATRVSYRINGGAWQLLALKHITSEIGQRNDLGRFPAGDIFEADLSPATSTHNVYVDLRIETADPAGNVITWTQSPALKVGEAGPAPPKRRSVR